MEDIPSCLSYCPLFKLHSDDIIVTLWLSFAMAFLIHTAPSQAAQEYPGPFCLISSSCHPFFSTILKIFLPQLHLFLQHHFIATASLLSAHHKGIFISQPRLMITRWVCCPQPPVTLPVQCSLPATPRQPWAKLSPCSNNPLQK